MFGRHWNKKCNKVKMCQCARVYCLSAHLCIHISSFVTASVFLTFTLRGPCVVDSTLNPVTNCVLYLLLTSSCLSVSCICALTWLTKPRSRKATFFLSSNSDVRRWLYSASNRHASFTWSDNCSAALLSGKPHKNKTDPCKCNQLVPYLMYIHVLTLI